MVGSSENEQQTCLKSGLKTAGAQHLTSVGMSYDNILKFVFQPGEGPGQQVQANDGRLPLARVREGDILTLSFDRLKDHNSELAFKCFA